VYQYDCDKVFPGCTTTVTGETPEKTAELVQDHLDDRHSDSDVAAESLDYAINPILSR